MILSLQQWCLSDDLLDRLFTLCCSLLSSVYTSVDIYHDAFCLWYRQRTVTRGLNKGVREDFRAALERQVGQLKDPCSTIIRNFLMDEQHAILDSVA